MSLAAVAAVSAKDGPLGSVHAMNKAARAQNNRDMKRSHQLLIAPVAAQAACQNPCCVLNLIFLVNPQGRSAGLTPRH
jgi:hypothetical protein